MIAAHTLTPASKTSFEPFVTQTTEPIYDTYKGKSVYVPKGYTVKVTDFNPTWQMFTIQLYDPTISLKHPIKVQASATQLVLTPSQIEQYIPQVAESNPDADVSVNTTTNNDMPLSEPAVVSLPQQPLVPRIYQEYGATFLIQKQAAILADAPGVGKTLQALTAAMRVMEARERNIDPLDLCYQNDLSNLHDDKNTHPTERPHWAEPTKVWDTQPYVYNSLNPAFSFNKSIKQTHNFWWDQSKNPVTVIVAPTHLCSMWYKAIRQQYPNEYVVLATGGGSTYKERIEVLQPGARFYIVNYEMMRRARDPKESDYQMVDYTLPNGMTIKNKELKPSYKPPVTYVDALTALKPVCVIYDESHRLKSHASKQAKVCAEFAEAIPYRFLLTATPIKREADDLFWQLHIVNPQEFPEHEYTNFIMRYCFYKQTTYGKTNVVLKDSSKRRLWFNRIESLETQSYDSLPSFGSTTAKTNKKYAANTSFTNPNINGYILGRSYKDVGLYLPPVIPANIPVQMDSNIRKIYEQLKATYKASFDLLGESIDVSSMIGMLHSLRILTACPNKYEAVKQLIEDNEGPFVIFCEYRPSGDFLAKVLDTTFISGDIPEHEREALISSLLRDGKPIVGMGRVIGTGINALADCKTMINFEADYTPGERTQRIGRVQRFSPNRAEGEPILLFDVMVTDSIDEHVYEVQRNRARSIKDIISVELGIK